MPKVKWVDDVDMDADAQFISYSTFYVNPHL